MSVIDSVVSRRELFTLLGLSAGVVTLPAWARSGIAPQPFFASVMRAVQVLADAGQPIAQSDADRLAKLVAEANAVAVAAAEAILDRYTLARVAFGLDGVGTAAWGGAKRELIEQGWKLFLLRVGNDGESTKPFEVLNGRPIFRHGEGPGRMSVQGNEQRAYLFDTWNKAPLIEEMWLLPKLASQNPLSGTPVEYKVLELFSRDRGPRKAPLAFLHGTTDYCTLAPVEFTARPSRDVTLNILDADGVGCMASLVVKDDRNHVYPPQPMRIAPDFAFHPQIYRADGESVRLPDGEYEVTSWRGPEYLRLSQRARIAGGEQTIAIKLQRWIDPAQWGWYSGDTHIHNAGCAHYVHPTEGVAPKL